MKSPNQTGETHFFDTHCHPRSRAKCTPTSSKLLRHRPASFPQFPTPLNVESKLYAHRSKAPASPSGRVRQRGVKARKGSDGTLSVEHSTCVQLPSRFSAVLTAINSSGPQNALKTFDLPYRHLTSSLGSENTPSDVRRDKSDIRSSSGWFSR